MEKAVLFSNPKSWHPYSWWEKSRVSQMAEQGVEDCQDCRSDNQDSPRPLGLISRW